MIFVAARNCGWFRDHDLAIEDARGASSPATRVLAASQFIAQIWPSLHGSARATARRPEGFETRDGYLRHRARSNRIGTGRDLGLRTWEPSHCPTSRRT